MAFSIVDIREISELTEVAAEWFSSKWGIPKEAYVESMSCSLTGEGGVPSWYLAIDEGKEIVGGVGVIENDFHDRKDLTPNVCALFVEERARGKGLAGALLSRAVNDLSKNGISTVYLLTDHDCFYERYGWQFFCPVKADGEDYMSRMYIHKQ